MNVRQTSVNGGEMDRLNTSGLLTQAVSSLRTIRTRTWLILGGIVLLIIGLIVWAGIALLSWMWAQAPAATEMGKRAVTEGATRIEQVAPDLKAQAERWLPGVKEQVDRWVPGLGDEPPARDVSGADPGPVPRYPGLVRSHYASDGGTIDVHYAGRRFRRGARALCAGFCRRRLRAGGDLRHTRCGTAPVPARR
jgi:hypothetical protein